MRILIATPLYPPEIGGPATYSKLLADGLPSHDISVTLALFSSVRKYPKLIRHVAYFYKVYARAKNADLVLALDPVSTGLPASLAARLRNKPFVVKIVGDYAWEQGTQRFGITETLDEFVTRKEGPFMVRILRAVQTSVAKHAQCILVPSQYLKRVVEAWGLESGRIAVIYNAIEQKEGGHLPSSIADKRGVRIVTAGRLVPWKNMDKVIDAFVDIQKRIPSASLVIAGDGPDRHKLETYAAQRLSGGYVFTGNLSPADMDRVIKSADLFVLNSSYEGLSHVLIEALASGIPVVATRAGGNGELVQDGKNGLLIEVNDTPSLVSACMRILGDSSYAEGMGRSASETGKQFSTARMLEATAEFLRTV